jgi:hypothetical protein
MLVAGEVKIDRLLGTRGIDAASISAQVNPFAPGLDRGHIVRPSVGPAVEHVSVRRKESGW